MNTIRYPILKLWVDSVNMEQAVQNVMAFIETGNKLYSVFASNPEKNYSIPSDRKVYEVYKNSDLLIPDGIGMVIGARLLYNANIDRTPGCELMLNICQIASQKGYKVFLFGASENVNQIAAQKLVERYPELQIAGRSHGYVREERMSEIIDEINSSGAQILFLGLGSPKQEKWFAKYKSHLRTLKVCQGVGGSLDVVAGKTRRAPGWCRRSGFEWLYRMLHEPKRLKRQIILPAFAFQILLEWIRSGKYKHFPYKR